MKRWYNRLLPRSLRPRNGDRAGTPEADRQRGLEVRVETAHERIDRLERKLARVPEDEYTRQLRRALLGGGA